jgi:hypothetical protein
MLIAPNSSGFSIRSNISFSSVNHSESLVRDCHDKGSTQQEEDSFHQQTGLKFKEETSEVLHL